MNLNIDSILIIEDDLNTLQSYQDILSREIAHVYVAKDGEEALKLFQKYNPQVVLVDIHIPIYNGIKVSKHIKEISPNTYIILITANDDRDILLDALDIGVDKFLLKPISQKTLFDILNRHSIVLENSFKTIQNEINFHHFVENAKNLMVQLDNIGNIRYINKIAIKYFDKPAEYMIGKNISDFLSKNSVAKVHFYIKKFKESKNRFHIVEDRFESIHNRMFYIVANIEKVCENDGNLMYVNITANDVTQLKIREQKIKKIHNQMMLEQKIAKICSFDCNPNLESTLQVSKNFYAIFDLEQDMQLTLNEFIENFVHKNYQEFFLRHKADILNLKEKFLKIDLILRTFKGREFYANMYCMPVVKNEKIEKVHTVIQDVNQNVENTKKLHFELKINRTLATISHKIAKGDFSIEELAYTFLTELRNIIKFNNGYILISNDYVVDDVYTVCKCENEEQKVECCVRKISIDELPSISSLTPNFQEGFYTNSKKLISRDGKSMEFENYMTVPASFDNKIIGEIALANKEKSFNSKDLEALKRVATLFGLALNRVKNEKEISDSQREYKAIIDTTKEGFAIISLDLEILDINEAFCKLIGYDKNEIIGKHPINFVALEDRKIILNSDFSKIDSFENRVYEVRMLHKDGSLVPVLVNATTLRDEKGEPYRSFAFYTNLSERYNYEQERDKFYVQLEKLNKQLELKVQAEVEKNRKKDELMFKQSRYAQMGEMINMIAHQWRQPLNAISSAAINTKFQVELGEVDNKALVESSEFIEFQCQKMSETINDFMNFFKPSKEKEQFLISEVIKNILSIAGAQLKNRLIDFQTIGNLEVEITAYKNELEHILLNLINNSKDAFDESNIENKFIRVEVLEIDDDIEIKVLDNAGGIKEEIMDRIFDPYFTTKEQGKGTGIGLYMTKNMVERNFKGSIFVKNVDGGAMFVLRFKRTSDG